MDKIGAEGVEAELREKQLPDGAIKALVDFISKASGTPISVDDVAARCADASIADDLKYIISTAEKISGGKYKINYTPSLVRGQGYYTGVVFEIGSPDFSGAVGGGGRYDNMMQRFGEPCPATGFALGIDRIALTLERQGIQIADHLETILVAYGEGKVTEAIHLANGLRGEGKRTKLASHPMTKLEAEQAVTENHCDALSYLE